MSSTAAPATVGGVAGVNGTSTFQPPVTLTGTYPTGTISNSTAGGTGFSGSVGTTNPTSTPTYPSWVPTGNADVCDILNGGAIQTGPNPNHRRMTTVAFCRTTSRRPWNQQLVSFQTNFSFYAPPTTPPVFTPITLGSNTGTGTAGTGGTGGNTGNGNRTGNNGAPPGVRLIDIPVIPLPPGTGMPPLNETRQRARPASSGHHDAPTGCGSRGPIWHHGDSIGMLGRTVYTLNLNGKSVREVIRQMEMAGIPIAVRQFTPTASPRIRRSLLRSRPTSM